jgi:hypothetical protein
MAAVAGSGMVVPSFGYPGQIDNAVEMGGEAVEQLDEADALDESAADEDSMEEDVGSEVEADGEGAEANDVEIEGNDENGET